MTGSAEKILVSVVIPSYNSEKLISKCLDSLIKQKTEVPYEIIIVDSSKDNTPKIVKEMFPSVRLIHLDKQTLPGAGRNIGVGEAKGEIIAFIDSDCVAHPNWIDDAVQNISLGYDIVGGSVGNGNPRTIISVADHIITFNEFLPQMPRKEVLFMPTCNFICTKKAFLDVGGFSPDLFAGEDTLFSYQAAKKYKMLFNPDIKILHHNRETFQKFFLHHYTFGRHSSILRQKNDLPGNILARLPLLTLGAPLVRFQRISFRMFRWNWKMLPSFLISLPFLSLGVMAWGWGFISQTFKYRNKKPNKTYKT